MPTIPASDLCGWFAASMMLLTFILREPRYLRSAAVLANLAFIAYGLGSGLQPVLVLHSILLPVNIVRLIDEILRVRHQAAATQTAMNAI